MTICKPAPPQTEDGSAALWAARVSASASLPDRRLNQRFAVVLATLAAKPYDSIPQAGGCWSETKPIYRFLENQRVTVAQLLEPIVETTARDCAGREVVYAIQDTSTLNYSRLTHTAGLGPINDSDSARGLHLHSTVAMGSDGVLIGLLDQQCWARDPQKKTAKDRKSRPIEEKESRKWLHGIAAARRVLQANLDSGQRPRLVHVMDREGDIHEVLQEIGNSTDGAVIRCVQNRKVDGEIGLAHQSVRQTPLLGAAAIAVRIVRLRDLSRRQPELPCTVVLSEVEWRALWAYKHKRAAAPATAPPSIRTAALWIGGLGGHLGRKGDRMPGVRTLWRGLRDLALLVAGYQAGQPSV